MAAQKFVIHDENAGGTLFNHCLWAKLLALGSLYALFFTLFQLITYIIIMVKNAIFCEIILPVDVEYRNFLHLI